jgi:hypothetical protein
MSRSRPVAVRLRNPTNCQRQLTVEIFSSPISRPVLTPRTVATANSERQASLLTYSPHFHPRQDMVDDLSFRADTRFQSRISDVGASIDKPIRSRLTRDGVSIAAFSLALSDRRFSAHRSRLAPVPPHVRKDFIKRNHFSLPQSHVQRRSPITSDFEWR